MSQNNVILSNVDTGKGIIGDGIFIGSITCGDNIEWTWGWKLSLKKM